MQKSQPFNYVYNYTDHLGNIRLSYAQKPGTTDLSIIEENHYYPFGLKHTNYNSDKMMYVKELEQLKIKPVPPLFRTSYGYKYQNQERQEELGLNWDSFKWRNYDYAIGRFMCIDPLAEKYPYNGTYNFSEDRVIDARELEGLEARLIRDTQSKCIDLIVKVQPVNNTNSISKEQFNTIVSARIENTANALSGPISDGSAVNASVIIDSNATIKMEYNDVLDSNGVKSLEGKSADIVQSTLFQALGITNDRDTQVNRTQVDVPKNLEFDKMGMPIMDKKGVEYISNTGTHEDLHQFGLNHVSDPKNRMNFENQGGTKVSPEQRQSIVDKIETEQKQN